MMFGEFWVPAGRKINDPMAFHGERIQRDVLSILENYAPV